LNGNKLTGLTKDKEYRKLQLKNLARFLDEKEEEICEALDKDLRRHPTETLITEIAPVVAEISFMMSVCIIEVKSNQKPIFIFIIESGQTFKNGDSQTSVHDECNGQVHSSKGT
jgi:hypothetical protein